MSTSKYDFSANTESIHGRFMKIALDEARKAERKQEVPVGAVLIGISGSILAAAHNQTLQQCDVTAHAEILAIREASRQVGNYRLPGTVLYTTVEPCIMCMGAIVHARIATLVYGAPDPKWGAAGSVYDFSCDPRLNHRVQVISGICLESCKTLIQRFFQKRRN